MFDYTKAAVKKIVDDFKRIDLIRCLLTQLLYIAYLIYVICIQSGTPILNIALLTLASAYFLFFLYVKMRSVKKELRKLVKKIYKWCKRLIKLVNLGIVIYGLSITASHFTAPSVILAALMIVGWVLEILFEVVFRFFIGKAKFILEGMEADYKNVTKPVKSVGNFFKKFPTILTLTLFHKIICKLGYSDLIFLASDEVFNLNYAVFILTAAHDDDMCVIFLASIVNLLAKLFSSKVE